jgi:hypothetical protein
MRFREQISQPGFVIDLMTVGLIFSIPIAGLAYSAMLLYRGTFSWHGFARNSIGSMVILGVVYLWKRHNAKRNPLA